MKVLEREGKMKKVITGIAFLLSLTGIVYGGKEIYTYTKGKMEQVKLDKDIKKLNQTIQTKEKELKEVVEKDSKVREEYSKIREEKGIKVVYLTFDDGPSKNNTPRILEILKKNNVKGTFFVIGTNHDMYKQIVADGHAIALHTYTHDYKEVYASVDAFFKDLYRLRDAIKEKTGIDPKVTRFPGGSSNTRASKELKQAIINRLEKEGYVYQDWNCDSRDASGGRVAAEKLVASATSCTAREVNILMHDAQAKTTTVDALQKIIDSYKARGYIFDVLTVDSPKFQHMAQQKK